LIHVGALAAFLPALFQWSSVFAMIALCVTTSGFGISLCFHRSLTHRGLRLVKPLEYAAAFLGTLALQGGPITWVATHRAHHAATDREGDPHGADRGFFWSHCEWLLRRNTAVPNEAARPRLVPELAQDPFYQFLDHNNVQLQIALGLALFAIGGFSLLVWGIFVRLVLMYHTTWLVNSASHMFGYRTYKTNDLSRNNWWVALLSWGEGWHNNHHAFQFSARLGLRWFEVDVIWWLIRALAFLRLVRDIKVPSLEMRQRLNVSQTTS
jgi:stearoyl-CoA desaturase (delta-9 desaturase)